jgi:N-acetylmuramic acid 6-phosphate etherase
MLSELSTESSNPQSVAIDSVSTTEMLQIMNAADAEVAAAVQKEIPKIAEAVDAIVPRLQTGGRLFYVGAGTSGRLGVLDASECPPTFNTPPELVQAIIAGGDRALRTAIEGVEDDPKQAVEDLKGRGFRGSDTLVGIAASGRTPYVLEGIRYARSLDALTVGISCTSSSELGSASDIAITPVPGPEILTGSTRLRAGTATKLVLNMLSTGVMIRLGYVYGNLMVNVQPTNVKLRDRARRIIVQLVGISYEDAGLLLERAGSVKTAVVMYHCGVSRPEAEQLLKDANGQLRQALEGWQASAKPR